MSRNLKLYVDDILLSIDKIKKYTFTLSYDEFLEDEKTLDAVIYNLQIIGEASKNIPEHIKVKYTQVEWKKIIGLRNIIAHTYFSLDYEVIWNIIETKELENLQTCLQIIINTENLEI